MPAVPSGCAGRPILQGLPFLTRQRATLYRRTMRRGPAGIVHGAAQARVPARLRTAQ
jgi:hypothetical protein